MSSNLSLNDNRSQTVPGFEEGRLPAQFLHAQGVHQITK